MRNSPCDRSELTLMREREGQRAFFPRSCVRSHPEQGRERRRGNRFASTSFFTLFSRIYSRPTRSRTWIKAVATPSRKDSARGRSNFRERAVEMKWCLGSFGSWGRTRAWAQPSGRRSLFSPCVYIYRVEARKWELYDGLRGTIGET